jgi:E3 ubiquitin-protein ligase RNF5
METFRDKTSPPVCPVCKNVLSRDRIIPIFGRGAAGAADDDPRVRVEVPRPVPQREEAPNVPRGGHFGPAPLFPGGGFNFSVFGFPGVMAFGGNFGNFAGAAPLPEMTPEQRRQQQFLSQIMLFIGIAVLSAIFFA